MINGTRAILKLKGDKAEKPEMCLGAVLQEVESDNGTKCLMLSSEKYLEAAIKTVDVKFVMKGQELPPKYDMPVMSCHHPAEDMSAELHDGDSQCHQELIGVLCWAVEMGRLDMMLEVALLSSHLALPRDGHLQQVYHIFGCLKKSSRRCALIDPDHPDISEERFSKFD